MSAGLNKSNGYILVAVLRQHQSTQRQSAIIRNNTASNNEEQSSSTIPSAGELLLSLNAPQGPLRHNDSPPIIRQTAQYSNHNLKPQSSRIPLPNAPPISGENQESSDYFRDIFPCLHPVNPHMRSAEARLQTFLDNSSTWPAHRIRATPQQTVDAGMYYLGERDRVKCWYCNGGLQNWERDDDPMEEHAKWFPLCEFVLQQKGPDYVHQVLLRNPGLRRPNLYNPSSGQAAQSLVRMLHSGQSQINRTPPLRNSLMSFPVVIDPQLEIAERNRKISEEIRSSNDVAQARMMGFDDDVIKKALKRLVFLIVQFCL